jgi:hypothetical protein
MQENLILGVIPPNIRLQSRHRIRNIDSHRRRPTDENTCPASEDAFAINASRRHLLQHVAEIRAAVLGAPAFLLDLGAHEGEAHEVLLELGWCGWEAEVEGGTGFRGGDFDLHFCGFDPRVCLCWFFW